MKFFETLVECEPLLRSGKIGVIRTDTIYGVVGRADSQAAVQRIYDIKGRDADKSPIILISSQADMLDEVDPVTADRLNELWPGKVSVIVPSPAGPVWLERGNKSLAYRMPADDDLLELVRQTGPLVAPSANRQGQTPATTITQAQEYFGDSVDFYVDGGQVTDNTPSKLYRLVNDSLEQLR
ncbi:MAG: L-threonylcarbamoyladenylate synthase [bacterium]|nr:L-threonylcarbamoyladenylate synthase [bacterium]